MTTKSFIRRRTDWVRILEAAADDRGTDKAWAENLVDAVRLALPRSEVIGVLAMPARLELSASALLVAPGWPGFEETRQGMLRAPPSAFEAFMYPPVPVTTQHEIMRASDATVSDFIRGTGHLGRVPDSLGIVTHPTPDWIVVVWASHDSQIVLTRHERQLLTHLAMHIEAGFRARKLPGAVKATISPEGHVAILASGAPSKRALAAHAAKVTRARTKASREVAESVTLWPALIEGRASLVARGSSARRSFAVIENAPASVGPRALTKSELDVLDYCLRGVPIKLSAYALGLSPSAVSQRLGSAAAKLGLSSRLELLRIAAILAGAPCQRLPDAELSEAEKDVLALLQRGLSNREISALRARSTRTIANQVASLLRKTNSTSRRELVARSGARYPA